MGKITAPDGTAIERFVVGFSGGKDSLATALYCRDIGPTTLLHADTGWEHPGHRGYLEYAANALGLPLVTVGRPGGMRQLCVDKQMFPSRTRRFCTSHLKILPIAKHLAAQDDEVVSVVGVRAAESAARAKLTEWTYFDEADCWTWRPILKWSLGQVLAAIADAGVELHPHYADGAARVGCYPCIFARKAEIAALPDERVEEIAALERDVEALARDGGTRAFFHVADPVAPGGSGFVPIGRVVEWARTARGGRQCLLPLPVEAPCVAWGLCERPEVSHG